MILLNQNQILLHERFLTDFSKRIDDTYAACFCFVFFKLTKYAYA